jgi:hypothetical protein
MARFLSEAWFEEIESARADGSDPSGSENATHPADRLVLQQVVTGTPEGEVSYLVVIEEGRARVERPPAASGAEQPATGGGDRAGGDRAGVDLTITCDWQTATAIAQGGLSTQRALMQGRLRVRGTPTAVLGRSLQLANIDPVPPEVRKNTTY